MEPWLHAMLVIVVMCLLSMSCVAVQPTETELLRAHRWYEDSFATPRTHLPPFSFTFGGRPSSVLLPGWRYRKSTRRLSRGRERHTHTATDPETGLRVRAVVVTYRDYPVVEWTLYLKNTGTKDTPILESINALDMHLRRTGGEFLLHHNLGTPCTAEDYRPFVTTLDPGLVKRIGAAGGRPANTDLPYYNVEWDGQGMIAALGWPGQSAALFARDDSNGLRITAGQEQTHFTLHPGEEVRTPLIVVLFWQGGDVIRSQNIWRRWMIAHNLPRPGGKPMPPVFSGTTLEFQDGAAQEIAYLEGYPRHGLKLDYWWRDAGWYPDRGEWWNTGTWEPDPARYPGGLREVAERAHANGMKFIVWFEPERVTPGTWLYENHPEWLLGRDGEQKLLDLGNPAALAWATDHLDGLITDHGIDMYRQDFNMDPLSYWRANDTEDRQGITEIRHIEGMLALWEELKRRHPAMPFDNCASGGRRNDLEMMRRGFPLSKTDFAGGTTSSQCQLYGIASWLPYFASGTPFEPYTFRSNLAPWTATALRTTQDDLDYPLIRRLMAEWREVAPYYWGDFYPLTPYSLAEDVWMAWQFDLPEQGRGLVQAFRRPESPDESSTYRLRGLRPDATYDITDFDGGPPRRMTGRELMESGLLVTMPNRPWAAIITYRTTRR